MTQAGFENVLSWLYIEREQYQTKKFDYDKQAVDEVDKPEFWDQQFNSYIQRLNVFPTDSLQYAQAAFKLAATSVALCEYLADRRQIPKPGLPSGEIEAWLD